FLTIAMLGVIIVAFLLPIFGRVLGTYVFSLIGLSDTFIEIWNTFRWVISAVVFYLVLLSLYLLAPNKRIHLRDAIYGALFATLGWQAITYGFSYYVNT